MSVPHASRHLVAWTYRFVRIFVRLVAVLFLLGLAMFVYLRLQGVPGPLLREVLRRANEAGIPVEVDSITLTLDGWRADHVRYYSGHPDDLEPIFQAETVFFSVRRNGAAEGVDVEVKAVGIRMAPSVEWGIAIPEGSGSRRVDQVEAVLGFKPDRIALSNGRMMWLGSRFNVNGAILKRTGGERPPVQQRQATVSPVLVTAAQFQTLEDRLKMLSLPTGATIDIDFEVDTANYSASRMDFAAHAEDLTFRNIGFSKVGIAGSYAYPALRLERAGLFKGKQSMQVSGEYNFDSRQIKGSLYNSITSNRLMLLLPDSVHGLLAKAELRIDHLPRVEIDFGPSAAKELLNHLSGVFSIRGASYQGIEIEVLRGQVKRENNRLEFTELQGSVLGQESRAAETGSAMHGGSAEGSVFWDGNTREFGVDVDANLDPNILVRALSPIGIATNIIQRFRFKDRPPRGHVAVGADLDDSSTFYIDIQALASDVAIQGVEFSSVNITQTYRRGKLNLDPIAAMQGGDFIKGSVLLDFHESTAAFDALGSMNPTDLEDLICPNLNLFGNQIKASGGLKLTARGIFDWGSMQQTDFSIQVEAEKLELPVAELDRFTADVTGDGPVISVENATFGLFGGEGEGGFSIAWKPSLKELPYETDFSFSKVDFHKFLVFFSGDRPVTVSGKMNGNVHVAADMSTNFFSMAAGKGFVHVENGQLADLPLFNGFSRLVRKVVPGFNVFSITSLRGNFIIADETISSKDAYFGGNFISAKGQGSYCPPTGFDALVQVQMLSESRIAKVVRAITDPLMKFFEMKLTGTLSEPSWKLENF